jgi:dihydroceramide fatty acyl 2-hydroxylase
LQFFTRTAWWLIPAVWVPVVIKIAMAAYKQGVWLSATPFTMAAGAFIWTFVEYLLHRYVFHMKTSGYW